MDYYKKYLKYKIKYEKLKGGVLVFNENGPDQYKLLKTQIKKETGYLDYKVTRVEFNSDEKKSIETFVNFLLPNIVFNKKKLNYQIIKDIETIGACTSGMIIANNNILIKIFKRSDDAIKEIQNLENLFGQSDVPPLTLNKYYGFIAGKNIRELQRYHTFDTFDNTYINLNSNLFSNPSFKIDINSFFKKILNLSEYSIVRRIPNHLYEYINDNIGKNLIFAFFEKAEGNLDDYIKNFLPRMKDKKVELAIQLFNEIRIGLRYIHIEKQSAHYNINAQNIVYTTDLSSNNTLFQIMNFGSLTKIDDKGYGKITSDTDFLQDSIYGIRANQNYMYDYYCLLFPILEILGFSNLTPGTLNTIFELVKDIYENAPGDEIDINVVDNFVERLNTEYPDLNLPQTKTRLGLFESYKNIIFIILWTHQYFANMTPKEFYD
jgi:hypothetical protein